jgi:putative MATE family efflux protein
MTTRSAPLRQERDLTSGNLLKHIINLSIPSAAESALFNLGGVVNAYWLGQLGGTALAAVVMGTTLRLALISPMMGLSLGGTATVARYVGAKDSRKADHAVMQTLLLFILFVIPLMLIGLLFGESFLRFMGAKDALLADATAYLRIVMVGLFFIEMLPTMNGVIRGAGHPEQTMRINIASTVTMLALEPVLVLGLGPIPALGVRGDALAVVLGSAVGVAGQLYVLITGSAGVRLHLGDARPDFDAMRCILRIALPTSVRRFSPNLVNALLTRLVASLSPTVLTAYSLITRVSGLLNATAFGTANAAATLVGQNLGARRPQRAEESGILSNCVGMACALLLYGTLGLWARPLLGVFQDSPDVLAVAATAVRVLLPSYIAFASLMVIGSALGGAGDAFSPMWINILALWLLQLPLCWLLAAVLGWGPIGVWLGLAVGNIAGAAAQFVRFKQGCWKAITL